MIVRAGNDVVRPGSHEQGERALLDRAGAVARQPSFSMAANCGSESNTIATPPTPAGRCGVRIAAPRRL